jgi:hypothetical protein
LDKPHALSFADYWAQLPSLRQVPLKRVYRARGPRHDEQSALIVWQVEAIVSTCQSEQSVVGLYKLIERIGYVSGSKLDWFIRDHALHCLEGADHHLF